MSKKKTKSTNADDTGTIINSELEANDEEAKYLQELSENYISARCSCIKQFLLIVAALSALLVLNRNEGLAYRLASCLMIVSTGAFLVALYLYLPLLRLEALKAFVHHLRASSDKARVVGERIPVDKKALAFEYIGYGSFGIAMLLLLISSLLC